MKITLKKWIWITGAGLLVLWLGIPTFNKWRADKLVDELCEKDGGINVYETVTLPKERFNQWGQFEVRSEGFTKPGDEYYMVWKIKDIIGEHSLADISKLTVYQHHFLLYRSMDKKIIGEAIGYARRGGDPISPSHPSSYSCPQGIDNTLTKQTFQMSVNR